MTKFNYICEKLKEDPVFQDGISGQPAQQNLFAMSIAGYILHCESNHPKLPEDKIGSRAIQGESRSGQ
jgi:hypothetical protein